MSRANGSSGRSFTAGHRATDRTTARPVDSCQFGVRVGQAISDRIYCIMNPIRLLRDLAGLTQAELADAAGTSQPTIAAYEAGRKSPTLDTVRRLGDAAGLEAVVGFHPPTTREDRRSLHLHRAIARRLTEEPEATLDRARRTLALMRGRQPGAEPLLREWEVLLERPVPDLVSALTDPSPRARELRHATPFAGVLSTAERAEAYRDFRHEEARG